MLKKVLVFLGLMIHCTLLNAEKIKWVEITIDENFKCSIPNNFIKSNVLTELGEINYYKANFSNGNFGVGNTKQIYANINNIESLNKMYETFIIGILETFDKNKIVYRHELKSIKFGELPSKQLKIIFDAGNLGVGIFYKYFLIINDKLYLLDAFFGKEMSEANKKDLEYFIKNVNITAKSIQEIQFNKFQYEQSYVDRVLMVLGTIVFIITGFYLFIRKRRKKTEQYPKDIH